MLADTVLNRDLDEFLTVPPFKSNVLVRLSLARRLAYAAALFSAAVLAITGLANIVGIFSQAGTSEAYSDARRKVLDDPAGMSASLIFRCTISVRRDRDQGSTELAQLAIACRGRK